MLDKFYNSDCFAGFALIPDGTIDLIASDPPYGTTALAAKECGRHYLGWELDPTYFQLACGRLEQAVPVVVVDEAVLDDIVMQEHQPAA